MKKWTFPVCPHSTRHDGAARKHTLVLPIPLAPILVSLIPTWWFACNIGCGERREKKNCCILSIVVLIA
jgi:hypothetical protein